MKNTWLSTQAQSYEHAGLAESLAYIKDNYNLISITRTSTVALVMSHGELDITNVHWLQQIDGRDTETGKYCSLCTTEYIFSFLSQDDAEEYLKDLQETLYIDTETWYNDIIEK